jgi:hypothetical protein
MAGTVGQFSTVVDSEAKDLALVDIATLVKVLHPTDDSESCGNPWKTRQECTPALN